MHEMSIALEVCQIVEDQVGFDGLGRVREVGLVVGRHSGVEPESLRFCLDALLGEAPFYEARALLEMTPGNELSVTYLEVDDGDSTN
jgi:hydrogenase nickel incorporation protein HypA/HybF